jgi:hypothetical protein
VATQQNAVRDFRNGSFATGPTGGKSGPCPLCPDNDQILHLAEMTRWANKRHRGCDKKLKRPPTEAASKAQMHFTGQRVEG